MENNLTLDALTLRGVRVGSAKKSDVPLSGTTRFGLWFQATVGRALLLPFCGLVVFLMKSVRGYRIENLAEVRRTYRELARHRSPLMICANHLTFIDSCIMIWAMGSNGWYTLHHRMFAWNLPAGDFFKKKWIYRVVAYLAKCIFIHRDGSAHHKNQILSQCGYLLEKGQVVSIFPEGRRSRSGRFDPDHLTYGVGKIIASLPRCRVLCVYLRGHLQDTYSNYPPKGSHYRLKLELIVPHTTASGREAYAEITSQIGRTIHKLEGEYFSEREAPIPAPVN